MAEATNSKRSLLQATYTPIKSIEAKQLQAADQPANGAAQSPKRAWDKWAFIASLEMRREEISKLKDRVSQSWRRLGQTDATAIEDYLRALNVIEATLPELGEPSGVQSASSFADLSPAALANVGEELMRLRAEDVVAATSAVATLAKQFEQPAETPPAVPANPKLLAGWQPVSGLPAETLAVGPVYVFEESQHFKSAVPGSDQVLAGERKTVKVQQVAPQTAAVTTTVSSPPADVSLQTLLDWAIRDGRNAALVQLVRNVTALLPLSPSAIRVSTYQDLTKAYVMHVQNLNFGFGQMMQVIPVGLLHLERLNFTPAGIERGELIHSVPLAPAETINITHKEWSNTSEEFEKIVTDYQEGYSEQGVTEKAELSQSTTSQEQHSTSFNTGVTASGSYGGVTITAAAGYNAADSATISQQASRNQSVAVTRMASSRVKKEHKISFKVASAAGTEDEAVQRFTNPFDDKATRVDFYQLVRKWKVDLFRYGIRLTYDLTIPEPGLDITSKIQEINSINDELGGQISFSLAPQGITRTNYMSLAAQYGATLDAPPVDVIYLDQADTHSWTDDQSKQVDYRSFIIEVPSDYKVTSAYASYSSWVWDVNNASLTVDTYFPGWVGQSGKLPVIVEFYRVAGYFIDVHVTANLRAEAFQAWQLKCWSALHDAAVATYEEHRAMLKDRLAKLTEELGAQDPLSLRKIEREEVMKNVLRWLFGPTFQFVPPGLPANLYGPGGSVLTNWIWSLVLAQGEITKFLHHAIEWENMLYLIYPYFWSHPSRWDFKKYLDHPDLMHRVFLKSGSARVVLTIRPGYEEAFVAFLETGSLNGVPSGPYLTIAQEMEAYAQTNYPGIQPANPVDNYRPLLSRRQKRAWHDMENLAVLLENYKTANGQYPTTAQGLAVLVPTPQIPVVPTNDPWGNPYHYKSPGDYADYDLASYGANGAVGGTGEDADITSWADASLIGTWFEYTPTTALDIAINDILPSA